MTGAIKGVINMTKIQNEVQTIPHLLEKYRESEALAVICGDEACHDRKRGDFRTYSASCEDRGGGRNSIYIRCVRAVRPRTIPVWERLRRRRVNSRHFLSEWMSCPSIRAESLIEACYESES